MKKVEIAFKGEVLPPAYCCICGKELKQIPIALYYHLDTGHPYNHWKFICPDKKWYNNHTSYRCDQNGSSYSYEI